MEWKFRVINTAFLVDHALLWTDGCEATLTSHPAGLFTTVMRFP